MPYFWVRIWLELKVEEGWESKPNFYLSFSFWMKSISCFYFSTSFNPCSMVVFLISSSDSNYQIFNLRVSTWLSRSIFCYYKLLKLEFKPSVSSQSLLISFHICFLFSSYFVVCSFAFLISSAHLMTLDFAFSKFANWVSLSLRIDSFSL